MKQTSLIWLLCLGLLGCGANDRAATQSPEQFKTVLNDIEKQQPHAATTAVKRP